LARVLVLKAGSGAANNLIRSLKAGNASLDIVGCHEDPFVLKKSGAHRNFVVAASPRAFIRDLQRIVKRERIDLVVPTSDSDVMRIALIARELTCRTFIPRRAVIERCQDKYSLTTFLRRRGIPAPLTYRVSRLDDLDRLFARFGPRQRLWCRIREGTGSYGAIPVRTPAQVRSWIEYWEDMRGVPPGSFTLSEYLPGRDFCVQSLWKNGTPVLTKMAQRVSYIDNGSPSGVSSTPALAKTAYDPHVVQICTEAIAALDSRVSGVFFIDLKEAADGTPCITEINAGRFATITNIHDLTGRHNMAAIYVRLGLDEPMKMREETDFIEDYYLVRSIDTAPAVVHARELFDAKSSHFLP
jgi:glutathione synthase/RimK-type ligase-like ATP-grasp enzyme